MVADIRSRFDQNGATGTGRILVVVVTWNSGRYIEDCLKSLALSTIPVAVLVIDNASSDGTSAHLRSHWETSVSVLDTGSNLGYAGGNNIGIDVAIEAGANLVILMNPDATVAPDCIERLHQILDSSDQIGMVSPSICYESTDIVWYGGSDVNLISGSSDHVCQGVAWTSLPSEPYATDRGSGCVLGLPIRAISEVGLFDERYFLYYEETELSARMRERGFTVKVVPQARAWHDVGHGNRSTNPIPHYYMTRNRLLFASRYCRFGFIGALPFSLKDSLMTLRMVHREDATAFRSCARALLDGYRDFLARRFGRWAQA